MTSPTNAFHSGKWPPGTRQASRQTASRHWAAILDCDPETVFSPGTTVTEWDDTSVELLCWDGGALIGAPADLVESLRAVVGEVPFDLDRGFVAEYRTVERWDSSVALAERLGFERVARSLLVRPAYTVDDASEAS